MTNDKLHVSAASYMGNTTLNSTGLVLPGDSGQQWLRPVIYW